jgi:hypothetical protein
LQKLTLPALLDAGQDKAAPTPHQQDLLCQCLRTMGSLLSQHADAQRGDRPSRITQEIADDEAAAAGLQVSARRALPLRRCRRLTRAARSWAPMTPLPRRSFARCLGWMCL